MKNEYVFLSLAKHFNLKLGKESVFGAVNGQPLAIKMGQSVGVFSVVFAIKESVSHKISKEVIRKFSSSFKRSGKVLVKDNTVFLNEIFGGFLNKTSVTKLELIINWWTSKLKELDNFNFQDSETILLYNGIPGPQNDEYKNDLEMKIEKEVRENPVDNYAGFLNGGVLSLIAGSVIGIVVGIVSYYWREFPGLYANILLVLFACLHIFKKISNGFNRNSWKYVLPIFMTCVVIAQVSYIAAILWLRTGVIDINTATKLFINHFQNWNKYALLMIFIVGQLSLSLFFLKKKPTSLEIEGGRFHNSDDEEWMVIIGKANPFVGQYAVISFVLCIGSIFLIASDLLHNSYFPNVYVYAGSFISFFLTSYIIFCKWYEKKVPFSPFKKHPRQSRAVFIVGHVFALFITVALASGLMNLFIAANVYLDPWGKEQLVGEFVSVPSTSSKSCKDKEVLVSDGKKIELSLCSIHKKFGEYPKKVSLIKGKGLFFVEYYRRAYE